MICAVVLAAGQSRRMGVQKLVLPFAEGTIIAHIVDQTLASAVDRVFVVVGRDAALVEEALSGRPCECVMNPDPESEMLESVRCALRALPAECQAVLVVLGDQPGMTAELVNSLVSAGAESGKGIVVPVHDGRRGHPVLFSVAYRERVLGSYDDTGLRGLLREFPGDVLEVPVSSAAPLLDLDTPADYRRAVADRRRHA